MLTVLLACQTPSVVEGITPSQTTQTAQSPELSIASSLLQPETADAAAPFLRGSDPANAHCQDGGCAMPCWRALRVPLSCSASHWGIAPV